MPSKYGLSSFFFVDGWWVALALRAIEQRGYRAWLKASHPILPLHHSTSNGRSDKSGGGLINGRSKVVTEQPWQAGDPSLLPYASTSSFPSPSPHLLHFRHSYCFSSFPFCIFPDGATRPRSIPTDRREITAV